MDYKSKMAKASPNMKAVLVLASHRILRAILEPAINVERDSIKWESFGYGGQSGGVQTALSWAYCLFCDELPPKEWNYRDPFEGFFSLDRDLQVLVLKAMSIRHGFLELTVKDKPKSEIESALEQISQQMFEDERRGRLKVVKD